MSGIVPFSFDGAEVRVIVREGEPWFVLADVCRVLEIANPSDAASRLDDDEKGVVITDTHGGPQKVTIINESGLWSLVLRSRKPEARAFKKWITSEVIPAIRKTGRYGAPDPAALLNDPMAMRSLLLGYSEKVLALEARNAELVPKAIAFERIAESDGSYAPIDAAKVLGVPPRTLILWLRGEGHWMYRKPGGDHDIAYQDKIAKGWVKMISVALSAGRSKPEVMITAQGLAVLAESLRLKSGRRTYAANRIRERRQAAGLTQQGLAEAMDIVVTKGTVAKLETGKMALSVEYLRSIARALGVSPGDLVLE